MRLSGCLVQDYVLNSHRRKTDHKSRSLIHVGHIKLTMSHEFNTRSGKVHIVCHGHFDETFYLGTDDHPEYLQISSGKNTNVHLNSEELEIDISDDDDKYVSNVYSKALHGQLELELIPLPVPVSEPAVAQPPRRNCRAPFRYGVIAK